MPWNCGEKRALLKTKRTKRQVEVIPLRVEDVVLLDPESLVAGSLVPQILEMRCSVMPIVSSDSQQNVSEADGP